MSKRIEALADAIHALTYNEMMTVSGRLSSVLEYIISENLDGRAEDLDAPHIAEALSSVADGVGNDVRATSEKEGA